MSKVVQLLKTINGFIQKTEDDDITKLVPDFPGLEKLPDYIEEYEKKVARLLRNQRKYYINGVNGFINKDTSVTLSTLLNYVTQNLFAADEFAEEMGETTAEFLTLAIEELTAILMESIDKDVAFTTLSGRTLTWIEEWSQDLGELMKLHSHEALEKELLEVIENGEGIDKAVERLKALPEFDRKRARLTAQTEILTASSRSQWEAYMQSPAVTGKTWRHSGSKNNNPRKAHEDLDGTTIPVEDKFDVNGHDADYPRDPSLPASERVNCHCTHAPSVDERILGLSKEEKEAIREQVLADLAD